MDRFFKAIVVAGMAIVMVASAGTSEAAARQPTSPLGFKIFCIKYPQQCVASGKSKVNLTDDIMSELLRVNLSVNNSIRPVHDPRGQDVWTLNASSGDCEDYVVTKRSRLINMGVPASALRIASVMTRDGEGHAILVIKTDRGDYALDNLTNAVKPLAQTGHRVIAISSANPKVWTSAA